MHEYQAGHGFRRLGLSGPPHGAGAGPGGLAHQGGGPPSQPRLFPAPAGHGGPDRLRQMRRHRCRIRSPRRCRAPTRWSISPAFCFQRGQSFEDVHADGAGQCRRGRRRGRRQRAGACLGHRRRQRIRFPLCRRPRPKAKRACARPFPPPSSCGPPSCSGRKTASSTNLPALARFLPALPLIGGGQTRFQPVFVGDVAAAIVAALDSQAAQAGPMNWAGPTIYCFKRIDADRAARDRAQARCWCRCLSRWPRSRPFSCSLLPKPLLTPDQVRLLQTRQCGVAHRAGPGRSGHHAHHGGSGSARPICGASAPRANMPIWSPETAELDPAHRPTSARPAAMRYQPNGVRP